MGRLRAAGLRKGEDEGAVTGISERFAQYGISTPQDLARQVMLLIEGCHSLIVIHGTSGTQRPHPQLHGFLSLIP